MRDFEYEAPTTLAAAIDLAAKHNGSARMLAGGTDLIDQVRVGRLTPDVLIDVKKIAELNVLEHSANGLRLGAAVPCYQVYGHCGVVSDYSALVDSCRIIGGVQIQSRASVGGNLCNSGPAADSIPSLIALGAVAEIAVPTGPRRSLEEVMSSPRPNRYRSVPVEDFCTGPGKNVLQPGEILVALKFPARVANSGSHYRRFIPRNEMDIAVVGVGASVVLNDAKDKFVSARIALGAVAPTPLFAKAAGDSLAGQPISDEAIGKAAAAAKAIAKPITDMRGTAEFRNHITGVLVERVLKAAVARARGEHVDCKVGH